MKRHVRKRLQESVIGLSLTNHFYAYALETTIIGQSQFKIDAFFKNSHLALMIGPIVLYSQAKNKLLELFWGKLKIFGKRHNFSTLYAPWSGIKILSQKHHRVSFMVTLISYSELPSCKTRKGVDPLVTSLEIPN